MAVGAGGRILIVEDDADVREALVHLLRLKAYQVTSAANGQEALDLLRAGAMPNLILLDLMMPVMDGMQFRAAQLEDPALAGIPVVVVSAHGAADERALGLRAAAYLRKPIEIEDLLEVVARCARASA